MIATAELPDPPLITLPLGIVAGGTLSARTAGGFWLGGEEPVRCPNLRPVACSWSQVAGSPGLSLSESSNSAKPGSLPLDISSANVDR